MVQNNCQCPAVGNNLVKYCPIFTARRDSIARTSYGKFWLYGWLGVSLSQPVLYQND